MKKLTSFWIEENDIEELKKRGNMASQLRTIVIEYLKIPQKEQDSRNKPLKRDADMRKMLDLLIKRCIIGDNNFHITLLSSEGMTYAFGSWNKIKEVSNNLLYIFKKNDMEVYTDFVKGEDWLTFIFMKPIMVETLEKVRDSLCI